MNKDSLCFSLKMIKKFINHSLDLSDDKYEITGYELLFPLLNAVAYNTYVETIGNKADTLYLRCKDSLISMMEHAYLNYIKGVSNKFKLNKKQVILAFDYTDEDFYGEVHGFDIHGWTGKDAVTGHFKSSVILHCLSLIKDYIGKINLILFDRGFYDKDLMFELTKLNYPYLIFVPQHKDKKEILYPMKIGEQVAIYNDFKVNKNQSKYAGENILIFLKQIYDPKSEKNYNWVFATNIGEILLEKVVATYKKRWRIETQFRVQDEARIKCKSKDMKVRFFFFLFEQMLQTILICFFKEEGSFKEFLIQLADTSKKWTKVQDKE